jgi:flavin reductase (DIM6/NTAB) family NADH-FMN oxidoreductase RutF
LWACRQIRRSCKGANALATKNNWIKRLPLRIMINRPKSLHENHPWSGVQGIRDLEPRIYHAVDADTFKKGMRQLAAAVNVVSTGNGAGARAGFTATAVCSVSAQPPQLLVCVNSKSATHARIREWRSFCVNVLSSAQMQIAQRFADSALDARERFSQGDWSTLATGAPVLGGCMANFDCTLAQEVQAGTHTLFIGHIAAVSVIAGLEPLAFVDGQYLTVATGRRGPDAELWDWS